MSPVNYGDAASNYYEAKIESLRTRLALAEEALKKISKGEGRFSMDRLMHAENTIEDMKEIAQQALQKLKEKEIVFK